MLPLVALALGLVAGGDDGVGRTLVIAHSEALHDAAAEWDSYRSQQGWSVSRIQVASDASAEQLRDEIRVRIGKPAGSCKRAVLLLGDSDAVPCFMVDQPEPTIAEGKPPRFATDIQYGCPTDSDLPDSAVGRVPARSAAEARTVLEKVRRYESAPQGEWRRRIEVVAGEGHFGGYDALLENLSQGLLSTGVPVSHTLRVSYFKLGSPWCPPPSELRSVVDQQLRGPALVFNYLGHGHDRGLDRFLVGNESMQILSVEDVARGPGSTNSEATNGVSLPSPPASPNGAQAEQYPPAPPLPLRLESRLPVAILVCCSTGHFDRPDGTRSLAEAMLLATNGPVAVIAGSRKTHPYANAIVEREALSVICSGEAETIGDLELSIDSRLLRPTQVDLIDLIASPIAMAQGWRTPLPILKSMHAELYNLIGDPCTRLALPPGPGSIQGLQLRAGQVEGCVPRMKSGEVTIEVERSRVLVPPNSSWKLANAPVLLTLKGSVVDGAFAVPVALTKHPRATALRVIAEGVSESGEQINALGWLPATSLAP